MVMARTIMACLATPFQAMSYAVPCGTVTTGTGIPRKRLTPGESRPRSLRAMLAWSWYMQTSPRKSPRRARGKKLSAGMGPTTSRPSALACWMAGPITSSSSRPNIPPSPACTFRAATPSFTGLTLAAVITPCRVRIFWRTAALVMRSGIARNGTWKVTGVVHRPATSPTW